MCKYGLFQNLLTRVDDASGIVQRNAYPAIARVLKKCKGSAFFFEFIKQHGVVDTLKAQIKKNLIDRSEPNFGNDFDAQILDLITILVDNYWQNDQFLFSLIFTESFINQTLMIILLKIKPIFLAKEKTLPFSNARRFLSKAVILFQYLTECPTNHKKISQKGQFIEILLDPIYRNIDNLLTIDIFINCVNL